MEMQERNLELSITEHEYLTMEKTRKWSTSDIFSLFPYIIMAILQVVIGIRDNQLVCLCFAMFTLVSLNTHIHQIYCYKEKQAIFNIVCERLYQATKKEEE